MKAQRLPDSELSFISFFLRSLPFLYLLRTPRRTTLIALVPTTIVKIITYTTHPSFSSKLFRCVVPICVKHIHIIITEYINRIEPWSGVQARKRNIKIYNRYRYFILVRTKWINLRLIIRCQFTVLVIVIAF